MLLQLGCTPVMMCLGLRGMRELSAKFSAMWVVSWAHDLKKLTN